MLLLKAPVPLGPIVLDQVPDGTHLKPAWDAVRHEPHRSRNKHRHRERPLTNYRRAGAAGHLALHAEPESRRGADSPEVR